MRFVAFHSLAIAKRLSKVFFWPLERLVRRTINSRRGGRSFPPHRRPDAHVAKQRERTPHSPRHEARQKNPFCIYTLHLKFKWTHRFSVWSISTPIRRDGHVRRGESGGRAKSIDHLVCIVRMLVTFRAGGGGVHRADWHDSVSATSAGQ